MTAWADYLGGEPLTMVPLDLVVDGTTIAKLKGRSYRMRCGPGRPQATYRDALKRLAWQLCLALPYPAKLAPSQAAINRLDEHAIQVLPKSRVGEAIRYALNQWLALARYTENGAFAIDNNAAERALRAVVIGRRNWLFAGNDRGGETGAILYTFMATCRQLGVEPFAYLRDVLTRLPIQPADRLDELLPEAWQRSQQQTSPA